MPVTAAPARASDSASSPPPQPTSSTRAPAVRALLHVARTHGIEAMQWFELAVDIPESMRGGLEFRDFRGVAIRRQMLREWAVMGCAEV